MAMLSAQQIAQNWQRGLSGATEKIKQGVNAVTVSPTQKAAARQEAWLAGIQRAAADGRWQAGLNAVSLDQWKRDMIDKGVSRIAAGATAAQGKFASFMQEFLPHLQTGMAALESMPRGDLETNLQRMVQMARHNAGFRYSRKR